MLRILSLFFATLFHKKTPLSAKAIIGAGALYGASPLDLIPDILPIIGIEDDLTVIVIALLIFYWKTKHVRKELKEKEAPQA